jgi:soluble lytic murein transglycosylase
MDKTMRLKGVAVVSILGLMVLVQSLKTHLGSASDDNLKQYSRYAVENLTKNVMQSAPTSDAVPLPFCRRKYIDLSSDVRYPIPHWIYALPKGADKSLVLAIAKNESRFKPYAVSHKGAVGLMQMMPETASYMVQNADQDDFILTSNDDSVGMHHPRTAFDFNDPYVSLAVGSRYLQYLQERPYVGDNVVYLLAAYNAGPGVLQKWKASYRGLSSESFAAHIPYKETRNYVRKVLSDYRRYQELLPEIEEITWVKAEDC